MFIGVNTNIRYKDETFHIQTEDGGLDRPTLTTILFKNGAILSSKKTSYIDIKKSPSYNDTIKKMMQEQHKQMARDLVSGKFEHRIKPDPEKPLPETENISEKNKALMKTSNLEEDPKKEEAFDENQETPRQEDMLEGLIIDYLEKKDARRV